jgi:hypothetical protein
MDIKEKESQIALLRQEINAEQVRLFNVREVPKARKMVGKCFIFRNNSYGGSDLSERWNVFYKIIYLMDDGQNNYAFVIEEFQTDYTGKTELETKIEYLWPGHSIDRFWMKEKISLRIYNKERTKLLAEMANHKKKIASFKEK